MWVFEQRTGRLLDKTGHHVDTGYAGRNFRKPDGSVQMGKCNPDMQNVKGIGPLPVGCYTIQPPHDDLVVGRYAMRLTPFPGNEMFGRNSFFIHGDSLEHPGQASHGCIVVSFISRQLIWASGDHDIRVIAG